MNVSQIDLITAVLKFLLKENPEAILSDEKMKQIIRHCTHIADALNDEIE